MKWNAAAITLVTCRKQLDLTCIHLTCASVLRIREVGGTPLCPVLEQRFAAVLGWWKVAVEVVEALEMKIEMRRKKMRRKKTGRGMTAAGRGPEPLTDDSSAPGVSFATRKCRRPR